MSLGVRPNHPLHRYYDPAARSVLSMAPFVVHLHVPATMPN